MYCLFPVQKEGECPTLSINNCEQQCINDAHCTMDLKCCPNGCGTSCVVPVKPAEIPAQLVTTASYLPAYTDVPAQIGCKITFNS